MNERRSYRGICLGLAMAILLSAATPWNDLVLGNTSLIGSFFPLGLIVVLLLVLFLNALIARARGKAFWSRSDLATALALSFIACAIPASGLMRYLPAGLIGLQHQATLNPERAKLLTNLNLPAALLPRHDASSPLAQPDSTVSNYYARTPGDSTASAYSRVPWADWLRPAIVWGALLAAIYTALIALSHIVFQQWAVNEKLAFPLATVYGLLIEDPKPGRVLNPLLSSPLFWIAAVAVIALHLLNGLHAYVPAVPGVPLKFDMSTILSEQPWDRIDPFAKRGALFFSVVGLCLFIRSDVAFSMWFCFLLLQVYRMIDPSRPLDLGHPAATDQSFGALLAFAAGTIWVGRRHYAMVARQMVARVGTGEQSYRWAGWALVAAIAVAIGWLVWAGAGLVGAACVVLMAITVLMVVARVTAETGLFFVQLNAPVQQPFLLAAATMEGVRPATGSFFLGSLFTGFFTHDARESMATFATHGQVIAAAGAESRSGLPRRWPMLVAITILLAFVVAGASTLMAEYSQSMSRAEPPAFPLNPYGTDNVPANQILDPTARFASGASATPHSRLANVTFGAGLLGLLTTLRFWLPAWPLHPIGYLLLYTRPISLVWFSLLCGWVIKNVILKLGGSSLFRKATPLFVGLMLGEIAAAAMWMIATAVLAARGIPYQPISILP